MADMMYRWAFILENYDLPKNAWQSIIITVAEVCVVQHKYIQISGQKREQKNIADTTNALRTIPYINIY